MPSQSLPAALSESAAEAQEVIRSSPETGAQHLTFWAENTTESCGYVYVIQGDPGNPIKVGFATDVPSRLASLQTGAWQRLRLLYVLPGPRALEWQLHQRLKDCRLIGEWFDGPQVPDFLEFVADLAERMVAAFDGTVPDYRDFGTWRRQRNRSPELIVRKVEPTPVDPETAAERLAAGWMRPARRGGSEIRGVDNLC